MSARPTPFSRLRLAAVIAIAAVLVLPALAQRAPAASAAPATLFDALTWRHIGPVGNRVSAVTGVPGDTQTYYIGAASGGVFKTTDGGVHWTPIFDKMDAASIGALAIAPSDPNVVWAGTGEPFIRSNISIGNGIYKSTDAGKTWTRMGLEATGRIARIVIDPKNPDVVLAAAMGTLYGPQPDRGVFKTADGGKTWTKVLFVDENTGASDIVMDPNNPRILFAGTWQMQVWTWGRVSGGPGSGLYKSTDEGDTWTKLEGHGLPTPPLGKIGLAMSPRDSNRVYALIETNSNHDFQKLDQHQGVLWRSDDGGDTWTMVNADHTLVQRPNYYTRMAVEPDNANEVDFMAMQHSVSLDGGVTTERGSAGGDNHDIWIDPLLPDRIIVGNDAGVNISLNRGKTWFRPNLPIAQMYHAYTDDEIPYHVMGNRQDGSSERGPSNSLTRGPIPIGEWHSVGGCESGFAVPDPKDPNVIWSGCYEGILDRYDDRTGHARNVSVWPDDPEGWPAGELKYRFQWTFPIAISPFDHDTVYAGSQHVHKTTNGGQSWTVISPDLTTNDPKMQLKMGGLTPDDASPTYGSVLFAIAESPIEQGVIWAGSNDGLVHVTRDGGAHWTNVTAGLPNLPPSGTISNIEPSRYAKGKAYLTVDRHQLDDPAPYVYKTTDYGRTWTSIASNLPHHILGYAHVVREDPKRAGLLYVGTENAIHVSFDDGASWQPLQGNLPHAPVHWITVQERFDDLVVATYGRGFWIMDDLSPVRQMTPAIRDSSAPHLFEPRPAWRFRMKEPPQSAADDDGAGDNPPYGASITYYLKTAPKGDVKIAILDAKGNEVRALDAPRDEDAPKVDGKHPLETGIVRLYWDLRYERSNEPHLLMKPVEHAHVTIPDRGWRSLAEGSRVAPLAAPGTYTVRLTVGGQQYERPLVVLKDPHSAGTDAQVAAQVDLLLQIRGEVNAVVDLINEIESIRKQAAEFGALAKGQPAADQVGGAAGALDAKLQTLENRLFDLRLTNARQDTLRWPRRLYSKLGSLAGYIGQSDFPPTDQQLEVHRLYQDQLKDCQGQLQAIKTGDVAAFNRLLLENKIGPVVVK
jgi:photosystem II stability/assembly factor-like uncharacterized protein